MYLLVINQIFHPNIFAIFSVFAVQWFVGVDTEIESNLCLSPRELMAFCNIHGAWINIFFVRLLQAAVSLKRKSYCSIYDSPRRYFIRRIEAVNCITRKIRHKRRQILKCSEIVGFLVFTKHHFSFICIHLATKWLNGLFYVEIACVYVCCSGKNDTLHYGSCHFPSRLF